MNEMTWQQVLRWESLHRENPQGPRLIRFLGRPDELSPRARFKSLFGGALPPPLAAPGRRLQRRLTAFSAVWHSPQCRLAAGSPVGASAGSRHPGGRVSHQPAARPAGASAVSRQPARRARQAIIARGSTPFNPNFESGSQSTSGDLSEVEVFRPVAALARNAPDADCIGSCGEPHRARP